MHITDRLAESKWGVFTHYLYTNQNNPASPLNQGKGRTGWDACVREIDVARLAADVAATGAHYYFLTLMQGQPYMIAPNATFDRIAGTRPGEVCASRDVVLEIADELEKYGIDLYLYYTGDGPYQDEVIGGKFGYTEPREGNIRMPFVERWAAVLEEYAVRYGERVKGWWIDGCYAWFGYNDTLLEPYYRAIKKGNPNAVAAFNSGVNPYFQKHFRDEEFVSGEFNDFFVIPRTRFIDGAQAFVLAPLGTEGEGAAWGAPGLKHGTDYMRNYISCVNDVGGVVTVDVAIRRDGSLFPEQIEMLRGMGI